MKWFQWMKGRQNYYYEKMKLYQFWKTDCYLIRYSEGLAVGYHTDDVPGYKHYRLNIQLKGKNRLFCLEEKGEKVNRFTLFRADKMHSFGVTLEKGLILSFGLAIKNKG